MSVLDSRDDNYKGMFNVIRFNWPFYVIGFLLIGMSLIFSKLCAGYPLVRLVLIVFASAGLLNLCLSALVSHYVYDRSDLYIFNWLKLLMLPPRGNMALVHSGFDETSARLRKLFPDAGWIVCDFYNPLFNTETSIQRARKYYPPPSDTVEIDHRQWKIDKASLDVVLCLFAVHELRTTSGQRSFIHEAALALKPGGKMVIAEHLRDVPNFMAFGIGILHFFSGAHWKNVFRSEDSFELLKSFTVTPFVHIFILQKK